MPCLMKEVDEIERISADKTPISISLIGSGVITREGLSHILASCGFEIAGSVPEYSDLAVEHGTDLMIVIDAAVAANNGADLTVIRRHYPMA